MIHPITSACALVQQAQLCIPAINSISLVYVVDGPYPLPTIYTPEYNAYYQYQLPQAQGFVILRQGDGRRPYLRFRVRLSSKLQKVSSERSRQPGLCMFANYAGTEGPGWEVEVSRGSIGNRELCDYCGMSRGADLCYIRGEQMLASGCQQLHEGGYS